MPENDQGSTWSAGAIFGVCLVVTLVVGALFVPTQPKSKQQVPSGPALPADDAADSQTTQQAAPAVTEDETAGKIEQDFDELIGLIHPSVSFEDPAPDFIPADIFADSPEPPKTGATAAGEIKLSPVIKEKLRAIRQAASLPKKMAKPKLRQILKEGKSPAVRAESIYRLGQLGDYRSVEAMLDGLDDESRLVREKSLWAIRKMVGHYGYKVDDPPHKRRMAIKRIWGKWQRALKGWEKQQPDQSKWPVFQD